MGDSRYVLEPNVKDGKGGLRDLQTLYWIAKYLYRVDGVAGLIEQKVLTSEEATRFDKAQVFLWTVRCHMHSLTGRAEERLTFDIPQNGRPSSSEQVVQSVSIQVVAAYLHKNNNIHK